MRALAALAFIAAAWAQNPAPPLVNLGRLSITRVFGGGSNGGPDADGVYGVANAFRGGADLPDDARPGFWYSGGAQDYVIARFSRPVTVTGLLIEAGGGFAKPPESFAVEIGSSGSPDLVVSPWIPFDRSPAIYAPPKPVEAVHEVTILFRAPLLFTVGEIEILGPAPAGVDLTPVTPAYDSSLLEDRDALTAAGTALIRQLAQIELAKMRAGRAAADAAQDPARKAQAWFEVNRSADRLAQLLHDDQGLAPLAKQASSLGAAVEWCEPGATWWALTEGYERYLDLLPDGPRAEEAWWMGRLANGPRCGDFEGSAEEYEDLIQDYSEFLKRFPAGVHAAEARKRLREAEEGYKAAPKQ